MLFLFLNGKAQVLLLQDNFKGGVSADGRSYIGTSYINADTINFQNSAPSSSTIRKAFLISRRICDSSFRNDNSFHVKFNNNNLIFDSSDIVTNVFFCDISGKTRNWMAAKDVTSLTLFNGNTLIRPLINLTPTTHDLYIEFSLVILYDDNTMPTTNVGVFLNNQTFTNTSMTYLLNNLNPINNTKDVGLSVWPENTNSVDPINIQLNSSQGTYTLGSLYIFNNTNNENTIPGSFYYQNNTLFGLVDDTPDPFIDSTDALANIKGYVSNNTSNFNLDVNLGATNPGCFDVIGGFILAYSSTCPPIQNIPLQSYKICGNANTQLNTVVNGSTYSWYPGYGLDDSTIANPVANPTVTTSYIVTVTDNLGCHHTEQHKVNVKKNGPLLDSLILTNAICGLSPSGGSCQAFTPSNSANPYTFTIGAGVQSSNTFTNVPAGNYTLTLTDNVGCTFAKPFTIAEINPANVNFNFGPDTACLSNATQFTSISSGINNLNWFYNDTLFSTSLSTAAYSFSSLGTYTITLIGWNTLAQCSDTAIKTIFVENCPPDSFTVVTPNVFTPNTDGINDTWQPLIYENGYTILDFEVLIFDRWGLKIYESAISNRQYGWDGHTTSGMECTEGTYYYIVNYRAKATNGKEKKIYP